MKRNFASKARNGLALFAVTISLTSCSSLLLHRDQSVDSALNDGVQKNATVPKEQYDEMVRKYQELLEQSKNLKSASAPIAPAAPALSSHDDQKKPELDSNTNIDPSELVNRIDNAIPDAVSDTPDIVAASGPAVPTSMGVQTLNSSDEVEDQIVRLREVQNLIKVNKFENALVILKELENSKERQIVVRAKVMLGDLLFNQGEYDLASQVYEEVISKFAFSGLVLKALGKLVVCSEKLKQPERQAKYYSLLHDFFEAG